MPINILQINPLQLVFIQLDYFNLRHEVALDDYRFLKQKNFIIYFGVALHTCLKGQLIVNPE